MYRSASVIFALFLTGCVSTPSFNNFIYETSVRGEQGWLRPAKKKAAMSTLLAPVIVMDPTAALQAQIPNAQVKMKRWGVSYFPSNWQRYRTVLDADIERGNETVKCRLSAPETPVGAMTLNEVRANGGVELQAALEGLIAACAAQMG